jgi:mannose-6-phosphate isomerase-like protein (cupin superfamily)
MKRIDEVAWESSSHLSVNKKVLFRQESCKSNITQVAYTELLAGEDIGVHCHPSMEEIFFLINGICEFIINDESIRAESESVLRIPSNTNHSLKAITNCKLYYIGVSI